VVLVEPTVVSGELGVVVEELCDGGMTAGGADCQVPYSSFTVTSAASMIPLNQSWTSVPMLA
jgi:hypothetical protein